MAPAYSMGSFSQVKSILVVAAALACLLFCPSGFVAAGGLSHPPGDRLFRSGVTWVVFSLPVPSGKIMCFMFDFLLILLKYLIFM